MHRDEALKALKVPALTEAQIAIESEYVASKLNISLQDLQSFFEAPKKTYRDYKSQRWLYALGAPAMRMLGLELGGKR